MSTVLTVLFVGTVAVLAATVLVLVLRVRQLERDVATLRVTLRPTLHDPAADPAQTLHDPAANPAATLTGSGKRGVTRENGAQSPAGARAILSTLRTLHRRWPR